MIRRHFASALAGIALLSAAGCVAAPKTTRYQAADIDFSVETIQQQLIEHPFFQGRNEDSPRIRLMPFHVENQSNERLSRVDQWAAVARVFLHPDVLEAFAQRNIDVVMPNHVAQRLEQFGMDTAGFTQSESDLPTHAIRAVFMSSTRAAGESPDAVARARRDDFVINYTIAEADTGRLVWAGEVEFARYAHGVLAD